MAKAGRPMKYDWFKVRRGHPITVLGTTIHTLGPAARQWAKRHQRRFTLASIEGGVRVSRLD